MKAREWTLQRNSQDDADGEKSVTTIVWITVGAGKRTGVVNAASHLRDPDQTVSGGRKQKMR